MKRTTSFTIAVSFPPALALLGLLACGDSITPPARRATSESMKAVAGMLDVRGPAKPSFTTVDFPGARISTAWAINSAGDVLGSYTYGNQHPQIGIVGKTPVRGYKLDRGGFASIEVPGSFHTIPYAISDNGTIAGVYSGRTIENTTGPYHCFIQRGIELTLCDFPGARVSSAWGINPQGDVVGLYFLPDQSRHGFLLHEGEFTSIDYPGAASTWARGITPSGEIVGFYVAANGTTHGFLLEKGVFTTISFPGAVYTNLLGVNARGDIVGRYDTTDGIQHGYVFSRGQFTSIDFPGAKRTVARGINLRGEIVGEYVLSDGTIHAFLLSGRE